MVKKICIRSLIHMGAAMTEMLWDLTLGKYPSFVYGREPLEGELPPVFCLHGCEPVSFEKVLRFLASNGYKTLNCNQYFDLLQKSNIFQEKKSVLLTFDDGLSSVWSAALPLLRKYCMTAVVFVIPGRIQEHPAQAKYPSLEDCWTGKASVEEIRARDESSSPLCTWRELRQIQESGVVDIQCHTLWHSLIYIDDIIEDFVNPALLDRAQKHDLSMCENLKNMSGSYMLPELGVPLYRAAPRMGGRLRVFEDSALRKFIVEHVRERGGPLFFQNGNWRPRLMAAVWEYSKSCGINKRRETPIERIEALEEDLITARHLLESRLPGHRVRHLAFPWGKGSYQAIEASKKAGYVSNFWGRVDGRLKNHKGQDPYKIARIGENFLALLPGKGRSSLPKVLLKKLGRRTKSRQPLPTQ